MDVYIWAFACVHGSDKCERFLLLAGRHIDFEWYAQGVLVGPSATAVLREKDEKFTQADISVLSS